MALQFPISPSIGQTYQSGSSPIYTYNGTVWELSSGNTGIAQLNEYTASLKTALQTTGSSTTMLGNLNVQGTQTSLNQASLQITDKFIRVASGSLSSAQSNGAGLIIDGANVTMSWDSSNSQLTFNTQISASKFVGDGSGLIGVTSYTNSDNLVYLNSKGVISGSSQVVGILTSLNTYTGSNDTKWNTIQNITSSLILATSSYETKGRGIVSGSSQLTSSYDSRYVLSGSVQPLPSGVISGSSQLTASFDTRYINTTGDGVISGSSQLTSSFDTRYTLSGSVVSGTTPAGTVSGSSQLTSSFDGRYTLTSSFNSFTASAQAVTTGSNSFNGTQTITGSLIITTGSFFASQILANTSSLYLTSGSNLYVQNNGIVEITGSLNVNGVTTFARIGGDEGGEFRFGIPATNTTLQDRVTVDIFQNRFRIFEGSANAKGVYIDLSAAANGAGTNILNLNYFLEAYASVTYSLPGSYTNDTCRYSVVNTNINVSSSWFDTSTYTFTPQKAGYWQIIAGYDIYRGNAEASLFIQKNGSTVAIIGGIGMVTGVVTKIVYLNGSTDNIKIVNNGAAIQSRSQSSDKSFFQAKFLNE